MTESFIHKKLKTLAYVVLKNKKCKQMKEEYRVFIRDKRYIMDVAGFGDQKIAIECVDKSAPTTAKIEALQEIFDEIILIDVLALIEYYEDTITTLLREREMSRNMVEIRKPVKTEKYTTSFVRDGDVMRRIYYSAEEIVNGGVQK